MSPWSPVDEAGLIALAGAAGGEHPAVEELYAVHALYTSRALTAFAKLSGQNRLGAMDAQWRRWGELAETAITEAFGPDDPPSSMSRIHALLLGAACSTDRTTALASAAGSLVTARSRRVWWFEEWAAAAAAYDPDAPAYHAAMIVCAGRLPVLKYMSRPEVITQVEQDMRAGRSPRITFPEPPPLPVSPPATTAPPARAPALVFGAGFVTLAGLAGAGVTATTNWAEGLLVAAVLLLAAGCLTAGLRRPSGPASNMVLGAWAGGWLGLAVAALVGGVVGLAFGPIAGWPTFWVVWIIVITVTAALGAMA